MVDLSEGDEAVAMEVLSDRKEILSVTENGYGKRTAIDEYRLQGRGGSGIINMKTTARNGKDITFDVQAFSREGTEGYIVTIENTRTTAGRYADMVILTTDSSIKPTITVPVYGQILSAAPPANPMPEPKKPGKS